MSNSDVKGKNVLLIGPPNIGKSVMFNNLTGMNISIANYVGTTVEYTAGEMELGGYGINLIDVPGTYTLEATNEAERVAVDMLRGNVGGDKDSIVSDRKPDAVIGVIDAFNLESSLYLLFQVMEYNIPTFAVLNRMDLIEERGYTIDIDYLESELGIPVIPTVAIHKKGLDEVKSVLYKLISSERYKEVEDKKEIDNSRVKEGLWEKAEEMTARAKNKSSFKRKSRREIWGERLIKPWPGLPLSLIILSAVFGIVVGVGMGLRQYLLLPFFRDIIIPAVVYVAESLVAPGLMLNVLTGEYGLLVKGLEWPFTLVLPYVISFYLALSLLEDSGYLPRLGGLLDGILNKFGLPGSGVVPLLLGYGCGIPAIMATRALGSQKERIIVSSLVCIGIPCVAQSGAFIALLAEESIGMLIAVFLFSLFIVFTVGVVMDKLIPGSRPYTIMEIPELLIPRGEVVFKKVWLRIKHFIADGALPMLVIVGIASLLYETGVMEVIGKLLSPLVVSWLHLPVEASTPLILGVFRRELTVIPLLAMDLTTLQLFTGAVVGLLYVPCIAIIATLAREFKIGMAVYILVLTSFLAFFVGGLVARLGGLILI